jgi:intracellular sulfur oxidation DsrE/DsrF family protein
MIKINFAFTLLVILSTPLLLQAQAQSQEAQFPMVKGFGGIYEVSGAVEPDADLNYKIVVDLKTDQPEKAEINRGLNNVARMMNLHGLGGVKPESLQVAVVMHGNATNVMLKNEAYQEKYGTANPNLELIDALKEAGAELYVCGQSLRAREYDQEQVNPKVTIGLSMLTVVTTHMHEGYQLLVFD